MAQKESHFFYEETQARLLDVMANAYVKPLTVELEVTNTKRQTVLVKIPTQRATPPTGRATPSTTLHASCAKKALTAMSS